jgi:hypothetical protein
MSIARALASIIDVVENAGQERGQLIKKTEWFQRSSVGTQRWTLQRPINKKMTLERHGRHWNEKCWRNIRLVPHGVQNLFWTPKRLKRRPSKINLRTH